MPICLSMEQHHKHYFAECEFTMEQHHKHYFAECEFIMEQHHKHYFAEYHGTKYKIDYYALC